MHYPTERATECRTHQESEPLRQERSQFCSKQGQKRENRLRLFCRMMNWICLVFKMFLKWIVVWVLAVLGAAKCQNSSEFRYQLREPSELINYNSICYEYSRRTCCSATNFQVIARKVVRVLGNSVELSHDCRRTLTNLLCSPCDADVGQNLREGVCGQYCQRLYRDCQLDYFSFDPNTNQLRVCKEDDIICSTLRDIVAEKGQEHTCQLLEHKVGSHFCWNGEVSARIKGKGKNKVTIPVKAKPKKEAAAASEPLLGITKWMSTPLICFIIVGLLIFSRWAIAKYNMRKRQIRYM